MDGSISLKALTCFVTGGCIFLGTFFKSMVPDICGNILSEANRRKEKQRDIFSLKGFLIYVKLLVSKQILK